MLTKKITTGFTIVLLIVFLVFIRAFENELFYDPFLSYFKNNFLNNPYPDVDVLKLGVNLLLRYFLNAILSLAIIYLVFKNTPVLRFISFLYGVFFVILILFFYIILYYKGSESAWLLFYVRRFLIQPLFILLFIPAFYYQKRNK